MSSVEIIEEMGLRWKAPVVARTDDALSRFSGGALPSARRMANLDSLGSGPANRFRIGKMVVYPVGDLIDWMKARMTVPGPGGAA